MAQNIDTLKLLISNWRKQDIDGVLALVAEDFTWNNSGGLRPPLVGKAAMRADLERMAGNMGESKWRLFDWAEVGDKVWMEGVDEFIRKDGIRVAVPYAGVVEFRDGLIVKWREYYQSQLIEDALAGKGVSEVVDAMLDRPEA